MLAVSDSEAPAADPAWSACDPCWACRSISLAVASRASRNPDSVSSVILIASSCELCGWEGGCGGVWGGAWSMQGVQAGSQGDGVGLRVRGTLGMGFGLRSCGFFGELTVACGSD